MMDAATQNNVTGLGAFLIPVTACALISALRLIMSPFWAWQEMKNERDAAKTSLESSTKTQRERVLTRTTELQRDNSKEPLFKALLDARSADLVTNDDIEWVCDELKRLGYDDPFGRRSTQPHPLDGQNIRDVSS